MERPTGEQGPAPALDGPDAALAAVVSTPPDDTVATLDLAGLSEAAEVSRALMDAVVASGILPPHHVDAAGVARYSAADVAAVRAGRALLDAGLPLAELLDIATVTSRAMGTIAERAVDAFIAYVRDPVLGAQDDEEGAARLVAAYETMLPATERLVAHHLRRRLIAAAMARLAGPDGERA